MEVPKCRSINKVRPPNEISLQGKLVLKATNKHDHHRHQVLFCFVFLSDPPSKDETYFFSQHISDQSCMSVGLTSLSYEVQVQLSSNVFKT